LYLAGEIGIEELEAAGDAGDAARAAWDTARAAAWAAGAAARAAGEAGAAAWAAAWAAARAAAWAADNPKHIKELEELLENFIEDNKLSYGSN
jgi:hypothetical protein